MCVDVCVGRRDDRVELCCAESRMLSSRGESDGIADSNVMFDLCEKRSD